MPVEEFKKWINSDVKSFIDEKEVETLEKAVRIAFDYTLTHKVSFVNKANPRKTLDPPSSLNQDLISNSIIPVRMLPNPNRLVKTKVHNPLSQPYLQVLPTISSYYFLLSCFEKKTGRARGS